MATQMSSPGEKPADNVAASNKFSFEDLIEKLESLQSPPNTAQLNGWLENLDVSREEIEPYIGFKEGNYWRHRVCRNASVEMLVLCWRPGHRTCIHDHNGSIGAVKVYEGILWETTFKFHPQQGLHYEAGRERLPGEITGSDVPDIHQLGNPDISEQNLITIHIYAPPLGVLRAYKAGSPVIDFYTPDEPDAGCASRSE